MNYEVKLVNPKSNEERKVIVSLSPEQVTAVKGLECWMEYVQALAQPDIPEGFMPIGNGAKPVSLQ